MATGRMGRPAQRRGAGEGGCRFEDGYWVTTVEAGRHPTTGKRVRIKRKARTKAEALRKADEARQALVAGLPVAAGTTPLGDFLAQWITTVIPARVSSANTVANYSQTIRLHIEPALGKTPIGKLTPEQVDAFLAAKAAAGYSRNYVVRMRSVLADALAHAERRGIVARNVARLGIVPKCAPTPDRRSLTPDEARSLLAAATGERLDAMVAVGLMLGLRPGELTGLLWEDLALDTIPPTLRVSGSMKRQPDGSVIRGEPKRSTAGQRTVELPLDLARRLRDHRKRQSAERLAVGELWSDHGLVFCSQVGTPLDPSNVRRTFARIAQRSGLDARFPYLLRHTAASLLIDAGIAVEQVADLLGDDPRTLYRYYRHRVRPVVDAAAAPMEALFGAVPG